MRVSIYSDLAPTTAPDWTGLLTELAVANDMTDDEVAAIRADLEACGQHIYGGGAAAAFLIVYEPTEVEKAEALGFTSVEQMRDHQRWLEQQAEDRREWGRVLAKAHIKANTENA